MTRPAGVTRFEVTGVSCARSTSCAGVGSYGKNGVQHAMAVAWNGSRWRLLPAPPAITTAISCARPGHCVAVGAHLSLVWNGRSWRKVTVSGISGTGVLDHISCPGLRFCMAESLGAVVAWNGTRWKVLPGTKVNGNAGLWCTGPKFCMGVGQQASRWNGRAWTLVPLFRVDQLKSISCARSGDCVAIGLSNAPQFVGSTLAESWNGTAWRLMPVPLEPISSISCPTARFCLAMGDPQQVQSWNGSKWSALPSPGNLVDNQALSCSSPGNCVAVWDNAASLWNGASWQATTLSGSHVFMDAVSCASATMCMAIGVDLSNHGLLAEKWDGSSWSVSFDTPNPDAGQGADTISCPSTTFCMENTGSDTMSWDGTSWHQQNVDVPEFSVSGLSCGSTTSCVLTEEIEDIDSGVVSFASQVWNGMSWQASDLVGEISRLNDVSCSSATSCVAVGISSSGFALAESWNGSTWKLLTPVSP